MASICAAKESIARGGERFLVFTFLVSETVRTFSKTAFNVAGLSLPLLAIWHCRVLVATLGLR